MSDNQTPDERVAHHLANGPETWSVVKVSDKAWAVVDLDGYRLEVVATKRGAMALLTGGFCFDLWHKETLWYAGERVNGWKSWAVCKAEQERNAARWAK